MTGTMPKVNQAMTIEQLRALMEANGVDKASHLAQKLDVPRSTVSRWLNGERKIGKAAAALIRTVLTKKPK